MFITFGIYLTNLTNVRQGETELKNRIGSIIASVILITVVLFLAVDVGFSLYNPDRLDSTLPVCTLNIISGSIQVQTKDTVTWVKAEDGMTLEPGSRVRTDTDSHASLTFSQGTTTKLEPGTDLIVTNLEGEQDDQQWHAQIQGHAVVALVREDIVIVLYHHRQRGDDDGRDGLPVHAKFV